MSWELRASVLLQLDATSYAKRVPESGPVNLKKSSRFYQAVMESSDLFLCEADGTVKEMLAFSESAFHLKNNNSMRKKCPNFLKAPQKFKFSVTVLKAAQQMANYCFKGITCFQFYYLHTENLWVWLHKGALKNYVDKIFLSL